MDDATTIRTYLENSIEAKRKLIASDAPRVIAEAAGLIAARVREGGKILLCGNGGSAADCQHIAAEFTGRLRSTVERPAIAAIALTTDTSFLTARANDHGFDSVFERLTEALGHPGDALIAISTSGASRNVIRAVELARRRDILTIGLLGGTGGELARLVQLAIVVPDPNAQHVQEGHIAIGHVLCQLIEDKLYGNRGNSSSR